MKYLVLLLAILLSGCCENRMVYERLPMVPMPEIPVMLPDDKTAATWEANYVKAATFGLKLYLGVREHAKICIERNVARGTMTRKEAEVAWAEYRLEGTLAPDDELKKRYPEQPPDVKE